MGSISLVTDVPARLNPPSFTGHIREALAALHRSEVQLPDLIIDAALITIRERGKLLDKLSRAFATASPSRGIWTGWIFRLIEYFIGHTRDCGIRRSVEVPVYYPGSKKSEVFTLVVEQLPGGTGAIFPHPVFTTPIVLSRDARDVIERALRLILEQRRKKGFDDRRCDIMWYLKKAHCGSIVRSLQGASCGAGFALAISSLFDNEEIGHSLCVTGSVSPEGRILPIRAVRAKLAAVEQWSWKNRNHCRFIVPREHFSELNELLDPRIFVTIKAVSSIDDIVALHQGV